METKQRKIGTKGKKKQREKEGKNNNSNFMGKRQKRDK